MSDREDYEDLHDFEDEDDDIDNEEFLADDDMLGEDSEIDALHEEAEMDIEELRQRYCDIPPYEIDSPALPSLADTVVSARVSNGLEGALGQADGLPDEAESTVGDLVSAPDQLLDSSGSYDTSGTEPESELRKFMQAGSDNLASYGSDEDEDYLPEVTPRIGPEYQHETMPEIDPNYVPNHDADLLWVPTDTLDDSQIDKYLEAAAVCSIEFMMNKEPGCEAVPVRKPPNKRRKGPPEWMAVTTPLFWDSEEALYLLMKNNYDTKSALAEFQKGPPDVNLPRKTHFGIYPSWTQEDMRNFEIGMHAYTKNFYRLRHEYLPAKSVGEIVHFYYRWKKSERHDTWKFHHFATMQASQGEDGEDEEVEEEEELMEELVHDSSEEPRVVNNPLIDPEIAANLIAQAEAARHAAEQYWENQLYSDRGYDASEDDSVQG